MLCLQQHAAVQCAAEAIAILEMITDAHEILCIISKFAFAASLLEKIRDVAYNSVHCASGALIPKLILIHTKHCAALLEKIILIPLHTKYCASAAVLEKITYVQS